MSIKRSNVAWPSRSSFSTVAWSRRLRPTWPCTTRGWCWGRRSPSWFHLPQKTLPPRRSSGAGSAIRCTMCGSTSAYPGGAGTDRPKARRPQCRPVGAEERAGVGPVRDGRRIPDLRGERPAPRPAPRRRCGPHVPLPSSCGRASCERECTSLRRRRATCRRSVTIPK